MLVMLNFTKEAPKRIHCMIYKQQFKSRVMVKKNFLIFLPTSTLYFNFSFRMAGTACQDANDRNRL